MEANDFVAKLKANGSENDLVDLQSCFEDYAKIISKSNEKKRGSFALNVLCILCRNLEKVPTWRDRISFKILLQFCVECVRETRTLERGDLVKVLACVSHVHKYVVRQKTPLPPEQVLKLSYMAFERDTLINEYAKTYWNILADRILYIETLKSRRINVIKLLPKLTEDTEKVIGIFDCAEFCKMLQYLLKKLHSLYNDYPKELNEVNIKIFTILKGTKSTKKLTDNDYLDLYVKINDSLYVAMENAAKLNFDSCTLTTWVQFAMSLLGHKSDLFHCIQTFYSASFCNLLTIKKDYKLIENVLQQLPNSMKVAEKLGYTKVMVCTYPYLYQLLRLYIENITSDSNKTKAEILKPAIQTHLLELMLCLMKNMKGTRQLLICDKCTKSSGLHDSLRLSFCLKPLIDSSLSVKIDMKDLAHQYEAIADYQYRIIEHLKSIGCENTLKCLRKVQTDIHNTAIYLHKHTQWELSIKFFDLYIKNEVKNYELDQKNLSRAFYNKAICSLDSKNYEESKISAYLGLILSTDVDKKYINLVIDVKSTQAKAECTDDTQLTTVLDVLDKTELCYFDDLKQHLSGVKYSKLLKHEFEIYSTYWPATLPLVGIAKALHRLWEGDHPTWIEAEDQDTLLQCTLEIVLSVANTARTIQNGHFKTTIDKILGAVTFDSLEEKIAHSSILLMRCEFALEEARDRHGWRVELSEDLDALGSSRTIPQEYEALGSACDAVAALRGWLPDLRKVQNVALLRNALNIYQMSVPLLSLYGRPILALHMARMCCDVAAHLGDGVSYVRNAGTIISRARKMSDGVKRLQAKSADYIRSMLEENVNMEAIILYYCDVAIFLTACDELSAAARLVQTAQWYALTALQEAPDTNLDLGMGRLLDAQLALTAAAGGAGGDGLYAAVAVQRHYIGARNDETVFTLRRREHYGRRARAAAASRRAAALCARLGLWRRARAAAAAAAAAGSAPALAALTAAATWPASTDDALIKIDNRLKNILGLHPTNEIQTQARANPLKPEVFTPKADIETMLDCQEGFKKTQASPSVPCTSVPRFKIPEFMYHKAGCECYACETPFCFKMAATISGLEAATFFRARETEIAANYFDGVMRMLPMVESKLRDTITTYRKRKFEPYLIDIVESELSMEFKEAQVDILFEAVRFELYSHNFAKSDDYLIRVQELIDEGVTDCYVKSELINLTCASARLRSLKPQKTDTLSIEQEMDTLRLSPQPVQAKTPERKPDKPPQVAKTGIVVDAEEVPNAKRKVIKLNLDEAAEEVQPVKAVRKRCKIPVPATSKPELQLITPKPVRARTRAQATDSKK